MYQVALVRWNVQRERDPTFLGTVQDVSGSTIRVVLDEETLSGLTFIEGSAYRVGQIGAFIRIPLGYTDLFGIVSQVGAGAAPERISESLPHGQRWMTVQLAGQARRGGQFERGIAQYPTIGDNVHVVTEQDLLRIYGRHDNLAFVKVGSLAASPAIPALLDVNKLITRHSVVVGATGSGKSTTVSSLISALADRERYPSARVLMFDVHGEYARALRDNASVFRVGADPRFKEKELHVPYWALNFDEFLSVAVGGLDDPAARTVFADKIVELKREMFALRPVAGVEVDAITVDTPIPFDIRRLWWDFHTEIRATHYQVGKTQSPESWALELDKDGKPVQPGDMSNVVPPRFRAIKDEKGDPEKIRLSMSTLKVTRQTDILAGRLRDKRLSFLFSPGAWDYLSDGSLPELDLDNLLEDWIGGQKPATILDLSGIPPSIQSELVGALLRILFEALFWGRSMPEGGRSRPLLLVLEEAHSYLSGAASSSASLAVQRIAKEGRKYGLGLMIVSQRPAEIDQTILSQCGTMIAMRLSNASDRSHITSSVSDNLEGLLASLPVLRTGEAIIVGEAVNLPIRALIDTPSPNAAPDSQDPKVVNDEYDPAGGVGGWASERPSANYKLLLTAWRGQAPRTLRKGSHMLDWIVVDSTSLRAIAYEPDTETLHVEFLAGNVYQYFDVPQTLFDQFNQSASKGAFFNGNIKNRFRYQRS